MAPDSSNHLHRSDTSSQLNGVVTRQLESPPMLAESLSSEPPSLLPWKSEFPVRGHETGHLDHPKPQSSAASHSSIVNDHGNDKYLADSRSPSHAGNIADSHASRDEILTQIGSGIEECTNRPQLDEADITDNGNATTRDELNWEDIGEQYMEGENLGEVIRAALEVSHFTGLKDQFLPNNALEKIITRERVQQELTQQDVVQPEDLDKLTDEILDVTSSSALKSSGKKTTRMKIFAILGLMERIGEIVHFIEEGLYDSDLPFILSDGSRRGTLILCCKNNDGNMRPIELFDSSKWIASDLETFSTLQWRLLAPYFRLITDTNRKVSHYRLEDRTILPFKDNEATRSARHVEGGYGEVWRIKIHPGHHNSCADSASPNANPSFAIKRLHLDSYKAFNDEVSSLKRFSEKDYVHLIKLLVTFYWRNKYYLLFPWADGNLLDFWKQYDQPSYPPRNHNLAIWFSDQCRGLVQGLKMIHIGDIPSMGNSLDTQKNQIHGRHGDLKPENILWFKLYEKNTNQQFSGVMKISDFGLMRFHSTQSKSLIENVAVSRTYRPPEYDVAKKVSQSYDVWALGCVLLQFVTWYLLGWDEIDNFSKERMKEDSRPFPEDVFFDFVTIGSETGARFKLSVAKEFQRLDNQPNCSDFVADLLKFIKERLLRMDPYNRASCEEIVCKFTEFHQSCVNDEDYSLKRVLRPPKRTSTSLSDLTAEKLKLSQERNDAIRKNHLPEHKGPVENSCQNSSANTQPLAKERSAIVQDDPNPSQETPSGSKGKTPEKLGTVPEDSPLLAKNFSTAAISEETQASRPQSPSKKAQVDKKGHQPQHLRQFELDHDLPKVSDQFPDDPRRYSQLSEISQAHSSHRNPDLYFGNRTFSSPSGSLVSDAPAKFAVHSVESLQLSQPKQPSSVFSASNAEEHIVTVQSTGPDDHNVDTRRLDSLKDSNLQPGENPEAHEKNKNDGTSDDDGNASNIENGSFVGTEPPSPPPPGAPDEGQGQEEGILPVEKEGQPDQHSGSTTAPSRPLKAVKTFFSHLGCFCGC